MSPGLVQDGTKCGNDRVSKHNTCDGQRQLILSYYIFQVLLICKLSPVVVPQPTLCSQVESQHTRLPYREEWVNLFWKWGRYMLYHEHFVIFATYMPCVINVSLPLECRNVTAMDNALVM